MGSSFFEKVGYFFPLQAQPPSSQRFSQFLRPQLTQFPVGNNIRYFSGTDVYAEFTQLQRLLSQYQAKLGQAGKSVSAFTGHLWRRKNASGFEYLHQVAENEDMRDRLAATEVEHLIKSLQVPIKIKYLPYGYSQKPEK